jgi:hypothetical protein
MKYIFKQMTVFAFLLCCFFGFVSTLPAQAGCLPAYALRPAATSLSSVSGDLAKDKTTLNSIQKTVGTDGRINLSRFGYKYIRYQIGKNYAGKEILLTPYKGNSWNSGFNAYYGNKHIAYYDNDADIFFRNLKRRTDNKGMLYFGKRYRLSTEYANADLTLHALYRSDKNKEFSVYHDNRLIAFFDAESEIFLKTVIRKSDNTGRIYFKGKRYNIGSEYKGKYFILSVYSKKGNTIGFNVFDGKQRLRSYIATAASEEFKKTGRPLFSPIESKLIQEANLIRDYSLDALTDTIKLQDKISAGINHAA